MLSEEITFIQMALLCFGKIHITVENMPHVCLTLVPVNVIYGFNSFFTQQFIKWLCVILQEGIIRGHDKTRRVVCCNIAVNIQQVMRSKTHNVRRATQDLDIDFIRYSIGETAVDSFIEKLNCLDGIRIRRIGEIEELKQQDYKGKRVYVQIEDTLGTKIQSKLDLGVHNRLGIEQEEYCFDIAYDDEGASLLINTNEQMFSVAIDAWRQDEL